MLFPQFRFDHHIQLSNKTETSCTTMLSNSYKLLFLFMLLAVLVVFPKAGQAQAVESGFAPLNPEFVNWRDNPKDSITPSAPTARKSTTSHPPLGWRPSPVDRSNMKDLSITPAPDLSPQQKSLQIPTETSFDLRDQGVVTPVRNQNPYGTCWAFAAMASSETSARKQSVADPDYSEKHLAYYAYSNISGELVGFDLNDPSGGIYDQGGSADTAIALLSRGTGIVSEASAPYDNFGTPPAADAANVVVLKNSYYAPSGVSAKDNIKYLLKTYGAVQTAIFYTDEYLNNGYAFYNNANGGSNHAVTIVGWNDNYSRTNFNPYPSSDGAWIVKNSWGSSFGDSGYYYISYESVDIVNHGGHTFDVMAPEDEYFVYSYDPLGMTGRYSVGADPSVQWMANIFTAERDHQLNAVGVTTTTLDTTVTFFIYKNPTAANPSSGTLVYQSAPVLVNLSGFHRLDLSTPLELSSGDVFSVVAKTENDSTEPNIPIEGPVSGWSSKATASIGQSFISSNGGTWFDMAEWSANSNVCLKAIAGKKTSAHEATASIFAVGQHHSLRIMEDGTLWAWGFNRFGQLGDGTTQNRHLPVLVGSGYQEVASTELSSLGLKKDGTLWAWGDNEFGTVGDGTTENRLSPVQIGSDFKKIYSSPWNFYGLKNDDSLWAWGGNDYGQLGDGTITARLSPVKIGDNFNTVVCGGWNTPQGPYVLGLKNDGTVWAWGQNAYGRLGDGGTTDRLAPVQVGSGFSALAVGGYHSLGLKTDNTLWAWGANDQGQVGDGTATDRHSPVQIGSGFSSIAAGGSHSLGIKTDGTLLAWGYNEWGSLGDGSNVNRLSPTSISSSFSKVYGREEMSFGLKTDGTLWSWGDLNPRLGIGLPDETNVPTLVGNGFKGIALGEFHCLGLKTDATLWAWGGNDDGQLGDGTTDETYEPVRVGEDVDNDSLPDDWERQKFGGLTQNDVGDPDSDALTNLQEFLAGTNPANPDTDNDSMPDGWEVTYSLNPLFNDSDVDKDSDGVTNQQEYTAGANPTKSDTDSDGMPDKWEIDNGTNVSSNDAGADPDNDGYTNAQEYAAQTNPQDAGSIPDESTPSGSTVPAVMLLLTIPAP